MNSKQLFVMPITAVLLFAVFSMIIPDTIENAEASGDKKKKYRDYDRDYKDQREYKEYDRDYEREYKEYDRDYEREYKEYEPRYIEKYNKDIQITEIEDPYEGYDH